MQNIYIKTKHPHIRIIKGSTPFLISAPHAANLVGSGRKGGDKREPRVHEVVELLSQKTGAWGIFTKPESDVHNWKWDLYKIYKKRVARLVQEKSITLFIDVHGVGKERPFSIDYDFLVPHKNMRLNPIQKIILRHAPHHFPQTHPHDFYIEAILKKQFALHLPGHVLSKGYFRSINGLGKRTLAYQIRKRFKIPTVQLEINRALRDDEKTFQSFVTALSRSLDAYQQYK